MDQENKEEEIDTQKSRPAEIIGGIVIGSLLGIAFTIATGTYTPPWVGVRIDSSNSVSVHELQNKNEIPSIDLK
ncbi:MAG: hypothetical protein K9G33_02305 [Sneathiella sp.]|nr:hypothetical protein [Sneathiella sp.]